MNAILLCADLLALSLAVFAGFTCWSWINPGIPPLQPSMFLAVALTIATFAYQGLYPGLGLNAPQYIRRLSRSITVVYLMLSASMVLTKDWWANSRGGFLLSWLMALCLVPLRSLGRPQPAWLLRLVGRAGHDTRGRRDRAWPHPQSQEQ